MAETTGLDYDFVVVGAGSAGCVMAARLVEAGFSVALVEAGPKDHALDYRVHMPAALSHVLSNDTYNWFYHSEPEPGLGDRAMYCPRGRVLGGSSSINGMIFVRGNAEDFNGWARDFDLPEWNHDACLPWFKRSENCPHGDPQWRGRGGPMQITRATDSGPLMDAWLAAGEQSGRGCTEDHNGAQQEGAGWFDRTISGGRRFSTARGYLEPARGNPLLTVYTRAFVESLAFEGARASGVNLRQRGGSRVLRATREVILCAGAINSPQLLMCSGVGPADHLRDKGIKVIADLPGVGENLQDHLEIYVQFRCREPVSIYPSLKWYRQPFVGLQWYLTKTGDGATNHFDAGGFFRSSQASYPDLQCHFLPVAMNYDGSDRLDDHGFQVHVGPMRPEARGHVRLRSADAGMAPEIRFNYNQSDADRRVMAEGIELARELVHQPAFDRYRGEEVGAAPVEEMIRSRAESAYHPSCSCRMGSDAMAVVDAAGRVHGVDHLRIVDASIMPAITNGNLNAVVIMMAEKLADAVIRSNRSA